MNQELGVDCERVLQEDVMVAYLRGDLPEAERDAFERHLLECTTCFERLQVVRDLQGVLRRDAAAAPAASVAAPRAAGRPATGWLAWAAGAAFVAVGAAIVLRNMAPPGPLPPSPAPPSSPAATGPSAAPVSPAPPERPPLDVLARVEPPPYAPLLVRGAEPADVAFGRAMEHYVRGDYAAAATGLRAALKEDPASTEARFYLGVSDLLAGRTEEAIRELGRVAGGDDAGFADAARYYLAKAHLARRDVAAARRELQRVARGDGDHKALAQQLLQALGAEP
jgi:TolA-binding protein